MLAKRPAPWSLLLVLGIASPAAATFSDVTSPWGLFGGQPTWGAQIVDLDADGDLDLLNGHHFYSGFVFTNDGTGHLSVWGLPQLVTFTADRHGYVWADLDGDAVVDVACSHGSDGGCPNCNDDGHELWRGNGDGTYLPIANAGGMYDQPGRGRAFSAADIDGDGDLDIFHGKAPLPESPNSLYRNDGSMTFVDVAAAWGVNETLGTVGGLFADVDDDGDPDLFVGGEEFARPTKLFRNDGASFVDVTLAAFGATPPVFATADFGDWDNDGDLDLAASEGDEAVYDYWQVQGNSLTFWVNHHFGEDGIDIFELDTPSVNPTAAFRYRGVLYNDVIFLGPNGVHPTTSTVTLTDAYVGAPTFTPGVSLGLYCWRESPGGRWHVHVSAPPNHFGNFNGTVTSTGGIANPTASNLEDLDILPVAPRLYRNDGGKFTDIAPALGVAAYDNPRAVTWVDFDVDGDLDLHVVNRGTVETGNAEDVFLRNDGGALALVHGASWAPGFSTYMSDGAVWGDLDRDGDPDLITQEGSGPLAFTVGCPALLYRNDGPSGHWLTVALAPPPGGGTAIGAKVDVWTSGQRVHRRLCANSWRGFQGPLELSFGLGSATSADSIIVAWPNGSRDVFGPAISADQSLVLVPGTSPTAVPALPLGTPAFAGPLVPQPARGVQTLRLLAPTGKPVWVEIFDTAGRRVRDLGAFRTPSGAPIDVRWDGRDSEGRPVPAGVYFFRGRGGLEFRLKSVRLR